MQLVTGRAPGRGEGEEEAGRAEGEAGEAAEPAERLARPVPPLFREEGTVGAGGARPGVNCLAVAVAAGMHSKNS